MRLTLDQRLRAIARGDDTNPEIRLEEHIDELRGAPEKSAREAIAGAQARIKRFQYIEDAIVVAAIAAAMTALLWLVVSLGEPRGLVWSVVALLLSWVAAWLAWLRRDSRIAGALARWEGLASQLGRQPRGDGRV